MPLILAIEPDRSQASRVAALAPHRIDAEIVVVDSVKAALEALDARVPDLVLTPLLFSPKDDAMLTARLRQLDSQGVELQTLVIPVLASGTEPATVVEKNTGLLNRIRKPKTAPALAEGCAPAVFAAQINEYLSRSATERRDREEERRANDWATPHAAASAPMLEELMPPPAALATTFATLAEPASLLNEAPEEPPALSPDMVVEDSQLEAVVETETIEQVVALAAASDDSDEATEILAAAEPDREEAPPEPELSVESVDEHDGADAVVDSDWEDLESFLEDLGLGDSLPASETRAAAEDEPNIIELPSPDELWPPLENTQKTIAPIEGPQLKRRRPAAPAKTSKAPRVKTRDAKPARARQPRKPKTPDKPMQDEWGLYDPEQCGFAALLDRLQELTEDETRDKERGRRSAIMRR